jgi:nucleoporin NUP159
LAVYEVDDLLQNKTEPGRQIATEHVSLRALAPNPGENYGQAFALVLDSGALMIVDVNEGKARTMHAEGVTSVSWSIKGRALIAGLETGTVLQYMLGGDLSATIPRPPDVDDSYTSKPSKPPRVTSLC